MPAPLFLRHIDRLPGVQKRVTTPQLRTAGSIDHSLSGLCQNMKLGHREILFLKTSVNRVVVFAERLHPIRSRLFPSTTGVQFRKTPVQGLV